MKRLILLLCLILGFACPVSAQQKHNLFKEPSFWFNVAGTAGDVTTTALLVDGKRFKEGNPILRNADGTVNWYRAGFAKGLCLGIPALVYKFNPGKGRRAMWMAGGVQLGITGGNVYVGFKYKW